MRLLLVILAAACSAGEYVGFHGDGSGVYPQADPPTEWSAATNVVWRAPMPNWSNSSPVPVGDRIFAMSEPVDCVPLLVCLDAKDGKELWRREIDHLDPATRQRFSAWFAKVREVVRAAHDGQAGTIPPLDKALAAKGAHVPDWSLGAKAGRLNLGKGYGWQYVGFALPTPVSDGARVWTWTFPGVAACHDRDGQRLWQQFFDPAAEGKDAFKGGCTFTSSPVIVDGTLILLGGNRLRGLDPATGKLRWDHRLLAPQGWEPATPKRVTVDGVTAVFCLDGGVYRASDGKLMASGFGKPAEASPVAAGDTIFFTVREKGEGKRNCQVSRALRLEAGGPGGTWQHEQLWETEGVLSKDHDDLTPVLSEGRIYGSQGQVWDAATGTVTKARFALRYASPIVAGKYLICREGQNGARREAILKDRRSAVVGESLVGVYDLKTLKRVALNALPGAAVEGTKRDQILANSNCPYWMPKGYQTIACAGDRLYIRTHDDLWCVGRR